jgi:hypothetical protein
MSWKFIGTVVSVQGAFGVYVPRFVTTRRALEILGDVSAALANTGTATALGPLARLAPLSLLGPPGDWGPAPTAEQCEEIRAANSAIREDQIVRDLQSPAAVVEG